MKDIAIFGAGGFGREVACLIEQINKAEISPKWNLVGFFDDGKVPGTRTDYGIVLGGLNELNQWEAPLDVIIALGSPASLKHISSCLSNPMVELPNVISPDASFYDKKSVKMGRGNIVGPGSAISCNVTIGDFNILNVHCQIGHDAILGNCNVIMPSVNISGEVAIGDTNLFGVKSTVIQCLKVGNGTTLTPGSVLMRNAKDEKVYMGNPAKIFM